jgi:UDP-N-acetylglucosamine diphosphorylase/glucosamine-1-phosphate N-acetyltransferase
MNPNKNISNIANIILFDHPKSWTNLLPLTFTRPVAQIRIGILTIAEKWQQYLQTSVSYLTQPYLQAKYPFFETKDNLFINASALPNPHFLKLLQNLEKENAIWQTDILLAFRTQNKETFFELIQKSTLKNTQNSTPICNYLEYPFDIFSFNGQEINTDFQLVTKNRDSQKIKDKHTIVYNSENIFIEEGADLKACVLNAEKGVIYIGKNTQIQEMSVIQGNFALCEGSVVNIGGKMRADTTIGKFCKVGGEISNSVFFGYSNKAHDGFLGNSVIGHWCNLGADTNTSNLKNNYSEVQIWNYAEQKYINTQKQFVGLTLADHAKAGINTMFNTGTVVGVSANVFGGGFPPKYVPSFAWGGADGFETFDFNKALEVAQKVMQRRNKVLDKTETDILEYLFRNK